MGTLIPLALPHYPEKQISKIPGAPHWSSCLSYIALVFLRVLDSTCYPVKIVLRLPAYSKKSQAKKGGVELTPSSFMIFVFVCFSTNDLPIWKIKNSLLSGWLILQPGQDAFSCLYNSDQNKRKLFHF